MPIWGNIQALHSGLFIALFCLIVYFVLLNRTTLGYQIRAVGFNPEAARYSGISVNRNYFYAMGVAGAFAGLAGGLEITGWRFGTDVSNFDTNFVGFTGIAVALLGRNRAVGILFAALLFGALEVGTSSRQLDPSVFEPELASNLSTIIQALVIFFVGAELLVVYLWRARRLRAARPWLGGETMSVPELRQPGHARARPGVHSSRIRYAVDRDLRNLPRLARLLAGSTALDRP